MLRRALVALLLAVPLVSTGGTAQAAVCSGTAGVSVVVQFPDGHTETGCAPGDPATGLAALTGAGFSYAFDPRNPGFVCKIKGAPGDGKCMKPNYWAYFHAQRGGSWSYSSTGAGSYNPAPGSVEGWRFGSGAAPTTPSPGSTASPKPTPKPTTKPPSPTPTTHSPSPSGGSSAQQGTPGKATVSARAKAPAKASTKAKAHAQAKAKAQAKAEVRKQKANAAAAAASASASPSPQGDVANASAPTSAPPASEQARNGSLPWWWGAIVLILIGGTAGAVTVVRRR